jgi:hypothetical protein
MGTESGPIRVHLRASRAFHEELRAHVGGVHCLACNVDRTRMYSGSNDFTVYEWSVTDRRVLRLLAGHTNGVRCAVVVGQHLWTGSDDFTVKVWSLLDGTCAETLTGHTDSITCVAVHGASIWTASADKTIRVWSVAPLAPEEEGAAHKLTRGAHSHTREATQPATSTSRRPCLKVIRCDGDAGGRVGTLVGMGDVVWSPTGSSISVFNKHQRERVGSLSPSHQACISQICRVRQTETRVVWSYSLLDKSVKIWVKESNAEDDYGELVDKLAAAEQALTAQLIQQHAEAAQRQANAEALQAELVSQLEHALTSLTTSQLRGKLQTDEAHQLKATLEQVTKQRDSAEQRAAVADEQILRLRAQVSAHHARSLEEARALKLEISRLERLLGDAEVEKEALLTRVEALSLRAGVSSEQYAKLQQELVALRSANADAQTEIQRLLQCVSHADRDKTCLETELARVLHDLRDSRATLKEREREVAAGRAAVEQVRKELEAAREREQTMARQLLSLDIFKLDIIARELKEVEDLLHSSYKSFSTDQPAVKGQVSKCKEIVRNIINKCLSETQKLHIGTTVQGHDSSLILDILEALRDMKHTFRPQTRTQAKEEDAPPG